MSRLGRCGTEVKKDLKHVDVARYVDELAAQSIRLPMAVSSRDLGGGISLFLLDLGEELGLRAVIADLEEIHLMEARNLEGDAAAHAVAESIVEPDPHWIRIDHASFERLSQSSRTEVLKILEAQLDIDLT